MAGAGVEGDRTMAAVAYILTWVTGLIIWFVAKKDDHYARWHAMQAILYGVFTTALGLVLARIPFVGGIFTLLVIAGVVVLAIKAYQGEKLRLPFAADVADRNA